MKKLRFTLIAAIAALAAPASMLAVPAYPGFQKVTQPDGTEIEVRAVGDEYGHIFLSADNMPLVRVDGGFYYAVAEGSELKSSGVLATAPESRAASFMSEDEAEAVFNVFRDNRLATRQRLMAPVQAAMAVTDGPQSRVAIPEGPNMLTTKIKTKGDYRGLALLVQFKDKSFTLDDPKSYFENLLNGDHFNEYGATGSVRKYFMDVSQNQYRPRWDVYGPVTLANDRKYYGENVGGVQGQDRAPEMMSVEAVQQLDPTVDFSVYDSDGDGFIDDITLIFAGDGEATSFVDNDVWPHAYYVYTGAQVDCLVDGVRVNHYNAVNEWVGSYNRPAGIGTIVHEFSHVLGLPDVYDIYYRQEVPVGPGSWCVLDDGPYNNEGRTPPRYSAYEAYCMGWEFPTVIDRACDVLLTPNQGESCLIETDQTNDFFIFEARKQDGWDAYIPGNGMLVWHIHYSGRVWMLNEVNIDAKHQRIDLVEADNKPGASSRANDAFPGRTGSLDTFDNTTRPALLSWGDYDPGFYISEITRGDNGTITFKVNGGGEQLKLTGIESAAVDAADVPVEWYTLQGVRVNHPTAGGIYIRRQGNEVSKQLVR